MDALNAACRDCVPLDLHVHLHDGPDGSTPIMTVRHQNTCPRQTGKPQLTTTETPHGTRLDMTASRDDPGARMDGPPAGVPGIGEELLDGHEDSPT